MGNNRIGEVGMSEKLVMPIPTKVLAAIEEWRNKDLRKENRDVIQREFNKIFFDIISGVHSKSIDGEKPFYRVREHDKTWETTAELWAPPTDIAKKNRCNFDGEPMLYVSPNGATCFEELDIEKGKQVYVIKYKKKQSTGLKLRRIFGKDLDLNGKGRQSFSEDGLLSYQIIREFIRSEFMKPVCKKCDGTDYIYNFTASICDFLTMQQDGLDGFIYPSVAKQNDENAAFFPERIKKKLDILDVRIVKLISEDEWYVDSRVDAPLWKPVLRGKTHYLRGCFKGHISGKRIKWEPCSDLGAF